LSITRNRNRLVALLAACTLIACTAVYSAHALGERSHEHAHCDLCVHFGAGSPAQSKAVGKPVLVVRVAAVRAEIVLPARPPVGNHLPRGPPLNLS